MQNSLYCSKINVRYLFYMRCAATGCGYNRYKVEVKFHSLIERPLCKSEILYIFFEMFFMYHNYFNGFRSDIGDAAMQRCSDECVCILSRYVVNRFTCHAIYLLICVSIKSNKNIKFLHTLICNRLPIFIHN